ncbi:hypothetical protein Bsp3421_001580 [Burkholderia sp. FERM BP-3421]|uniref:hypothetical protein n=1 Tax=Burkholderia sp. FERM BP-3421 TaxID=1494466 RepID=UPI00235F8272|nr:hypothetical protein [Burkholderia sp. FERM BP-3421]WDD91642.1 hypothetical protein Bsp3421_001580 [Burkholderia sp. FERM BP-3421]
MKSFAALPAAAALLLALAAAPAMASARYDSARTPDTTAPSAAARQDATDAATRAGYGANAAPRAEAGSRATLHVARDPFTINGRSLYDQP